MLSSFNTNASTVNSFSAQSNPPLLASPNVSTAPNSNSTYKEIQALRALGKIDLAIAQGEAYLKEHPKDADVMLLVGLMFYQKNELSAANQYLTHVLIISPDYLDAKLGLINVKIAENKLPEASLLITQVIEQAPNDARVKAIKISFQKIEKQATKTTEKLLSLVPTLSVSKKQSLVNTQPSPLKKIQTLRAKGKLDAASELGRTYLKTHPKDTDIMLQVGLILSQQKKYSSAADYLHQVLTISPNYLDATFGLISIAMVQNHMKEAAILIKEVQKKAPKDPRLHAAQVSFKKTQEQNKLDTLSKLYNGGDYKQAKILALQYLDQNPGDTNTRLMLGRIYVLQKQYQQAQGQFQLLLTQDPKNKAARLALIDTAFSSGHDEQARLRIKQALALYPNDPDFLNQKATLYALRHQYPRAVYLDKKILALYPKNKTAKSLLDEIAQINPHYFYGLNEVGINSQVDYVSDLHAVWQYSTLYYNHDTPWGLASASINDATRLGVTSNQAAVNLFPVINKNLYVRLSGAYANQPLLFPTYFGGIEPYYFGMPVELSLGANYSYILPNIAFTQYTASISKEWSKYWASFRPNYYVPAHGKRSILYTGTFIRYFGTKDALAKITFGTGTTPDLANLTTIDFIVIKNNFVTLSAQCPLFNHRLLLSIGGDYQHWVFPNSRVREISGINIGFNYRFQGHKS